MKSEFHSESHEAQTGFYLSRQPASDRWRKNMTDNVNCSKNECQSEIVSTVLPFQSIENIRDLGGIPAADGLLIRPGHLFRSAALCDASKHDIETLSLMGLRKVFDLRTELEAAAKPDHLAKGWMLFHEPVLHETTLSEAFGSEVRFAEQTVKNMDQTMKEAYVLMLSSPRGQKTWKTLFEQMLREDTPILFHCTEGKDRTGMAAALIEHALGVPEDLILKDYLDTNRIASSLIRKDEDLAGRLHLMKDGRLREDVIDFITARKDYYEAADHWIRMNYGSWIGYLKKELGLSEDDLSALRSMWLLPGSSQSLKQSN